MHEHGRTRTSTREEDSVRVWKGRKKSVAVTVTVTVAAMAHNPLLSSRQTLPCENKIFLSTEFYLRVVLACRCCISCLFYFRSVIRHDKGNRQGSKLGDKAL